MRETFVRLELWFKAKTFIRDGLYEPNPYASVGVHDDEGLGVVKLYEGIKYFDDAYYFAKRLSEKTQFPLRIFIDNVASSEKNKLILKLLGDE